MIDFPELLVLLATLIGIVALWLRYVLSGIMATIEDIRAAVEEQTTALDMIVDLVEGLTVKAEQNPLPLKTPVGECVAAVGTDCWENVSAARALEEKLL